MIKDETSQSSFSADVTSRSFATVCESENAILAENNNDKGYNVIMMSPTTPTVPTLFCITETAAPNVLTESPTAFPTIGIDEDAAKRRLLAVNVSSA